MRLSNTLMMSESLMPVGKKAFTLAEVLITLSILGVVAALTIPSLVNRQSDLAAQVKLKKAISAYEDVIGTYMAEKQKPNAAGMFSGEDCSKITEYFKAVTTKDKSGNYCDFTTADGVAWRIDITTGNASVTDNAKAGAGRYAVTMWNANNRVNSNGRADNVNNVPQGYVAAVEADPEHNIEAQAEVQSKLVTTLYNGASLTDQTRTIIDAPSFLQGTFYCGQNKAAEVQGEGNNIKVACKP